TEEDAVVRLDLESVPYIAQLRLDLDEVQRRQEVHLGAITSTGLLHALWSIPETGVSTADVAPMDNVTLAGAAVGLIEARGETLQRIYRPPGEVLLLAARRSAPEAAISKAMRVPPIFQRVAMWNASSDVKRRDPWLFRLALRSGLGMIEFDHSSRARAVQSPVEAASGVPAVYRWLVAEIAFHSWLHAQTATPPAEPSA
ncbi:MAG: hypothetical protein WEE53_12060, partial [Acidimicrobiia bacterium]